MQERVWLRTNANQPLRISAPNQSKGLQSSLNSNLFGKCVESSGFGTSFAPKTVTASSNKEVNMDFSHSKKRARQSLRAHVSRLGLALALTTAAAAIQAADTIKVGVLHSLSGTMAISETTLKDTVLMLIEADRPRSAQNVQYCSNYGTVPADWNAVPRLKSPGYAIPRLQVIQLGEM